MSDNNIVTYLADKDTLDNVNISVDSVKTNVNTVNSNVANVKNTVESVNTNVDSVKSIIGATSDQGGTITSGTIMAKLNTAIDQSFGANTNANSAAVNASNAQLHAYNAYINTSDILSKIGSSNVTMDSMLNLLTDATATASADASFIDAQYSYKVATTLNIPANTPSTYTDICSITAPSTGVCVIAINTDYVSKNGTYRILVDGSVVTSSTWNDYSGHAGGHAVPVNKGQVIKLQATNSATSAITGNTVIYYAMISNVFYRLSSTTGYSRDEGDNGKLVTTYTPTETGDILIAFGSHQYNNNLSGSVSIDNGANYISSTQLQVTLKYAIVRVTKDVPITIKLKAGTWLTMSKTVAYADSLKIIKRIQTGVLLTTATSSTTYNINIASININKTLLIPITTTNSLVTVTNYVLSNNVLSLTATSSSKTQPFVWQLVEFW